MQRITVTVRTNKVGSKCETWIEVEDDAEDAEIEELARDAMYEMIEWNWRKDDEK